MNKAILLGNVGKDPEIRTTGNGTKVASFSLATTEKWKDKDGNSSEATEWHNITAWNNVAKIVESYVKKGDKLLIEGRITNRSYDDKDGNKKYITEVVCNNLELLGGRDKPVEVKEDNFAKQQTGDYKPAEQSGDDLPF